MLFPMFITTNCSHNDCTSAALDGSEYCLNHHPDIEGYSTALMTMLGNTETILERQNWSGIDFSGMDLSGKQFHLCRFTGSCLNHVNMKGAQFYMCMLDDAIAVKADFTEIIMESCIVSGTNFTQSIFTGSDIINTNFNGIIGSSTIFDETDLSSSRFVSADLTDAKFRDCNLVRTDFIDSILANTDFSNSNTEAAWFPSVEML